MTDLVQKIRDVLVAIQVGTMFRLDFDLMSPHLLSKAADEIERLTSLLSQSMAAHTIKDTTIATLREEVKRLQYFAPEGE